MRSRHAFALGAALLFAPAAHAADAPLIAVLQPTSGNTARGLVIFEPKAGGVHVTGLVQNLEPNSKHGVHVHEYGDCSAGDASSAGAHYSPSASEHGGTTPPRHAGDLGNIEADAKGLAKIDLTVPDVTTNGSAAPLVGRGLVVHAKADDLKTQPSGDSGPRIACGVLGVKKAQ